MNDQERFRLFRYENKKIPKQPTGDFSKVFNFSSPSDVLFSLLQTLKLFSTRLAETAEGQKESIFDWSVCPYALASRLKDSERNRRKKPQSFTLKTLRGVEGALSVVWKEQKRTKLWCILRIHLVSKNNFRNRGFSQCWLVF